MDYSVDTFGNPNYKFDNKDDEKSDYNTDNAPPANITTLSDGINDYSIDTFGNANFKPEPIETKQPVQQNLFVDSVEFSDQGLKNKRTEYPRNQRGRSFNFKQNENLAEQNRLKAEQDDIAFNNEKQRLTDIITRPDAITTPNININPVSSGVGGTPGNFFLKTPMGEAKVDDNIAIDLIARSNLLSPEDSRLPNNALTRGFVRANQGMAQLGLTLGWNNASETVKLITELNRVSPTQPPDIQKGLKEIVDAKGWKNILSAIATNPSAVLSVVGESLPSSLASLGVFITGSVAGSPLVGAGAAGIVTFGTTYADVINQELAQSGVDMTDEKAVQAKLTDPAFYAKAKKSAALYGIPVAVFDALSMGLAGKLVSPVIKSGATNKAVVGASTAELAGQGLLGSAGDFTGQFLQVAEGLKDEINYGEVGLEGIAEFPTGAIEIGTNVIAANRFKKQKEVVDKLKATFEEDSELQTSQSSEESASQTREVDNKTITIATRDLDGKKDADDIVVVIDDIVKSENPKKELDEIIDLINLELQLSRETNQDTTQAQAELDKANKIKDNIDGIIANTTTVEQVLTSKETLADIDKVVDYESDVKKIRTPNSEKEVNVKTIIVDLDKLKAASGDLQPRDRTLKESEVLSKERASNLDPEQLLESPTTNTGAPIITKDGTIISGNGRVLSLKEARDNFKENYNTYKNRISETTGQDLSGIENPILVRVLDDNITQEELVEIADLSNRDIIAQMSATERAQRDSQAMGSDIIQQFKGGDITSLDNQQFVKSFIDKVVTKNEQGNISRDGVLTKEGVTRIQNAILASAYENTDALAVMIDSTDDNIKAISNALLNVAPRFANLKSLISNGTVPAQFDITNQLTDMALKISNARKNNQAVSDIVNQTDIIQNLDPMVELLIKTIYNDKLTRAKSQKYMTELLGFYVDEAERKQVGGFLEDTTTPEDVVKTARSKLDGEETPDLLKGSTRSDDAKPTESSEQKQRTDTKTRSDEVQKEDESKQEKLKDVTFDTTVTIKIKDSNSVPGYKEAKEQNLLKHKDGTFKSYVKTLKKISGDTYVIIDKTVGELVTTNKLDEELNKLKNSPLFKGLSEKFSRSKLTNSRKGFEGNAYLTAAYTYRDNLMSEFFEAIDILEAAKKKFDTKQEDLKDATIEPDRKATKESATESLQIKSEKDYENQRVEKPGTLVDKLAERNKTALIFSAFEAAGVDPDIAVNLPIERQFRILQKMFVERFGMKSVTKSSNANTKEAVDQLLTGFHNLSALANFFNLPYKAIGLDGTLTFNMVKTLGAYGSYSPSTKTITVPRRVNSFAHEWFHALDHYLFEKHANVDNIDDPHPLMSALTRKGAEIEASNVKDAYALLVRAMFQDKADEALKLKQIDDKIAKTKSEKQLQILIKRKERILGGSANARSVAKTQFRKDAEFFAPIYGQSKDYWASSYEMFARVGEAFTAYHMALNKMDADFLAKTNDGYQITLEQLNVTKEQLSNPSIDDLPKILDSRMALTFPKAEDRLEIFGAMRNLIDAIAAETTLGDGEVGKTASEDTRIDVRKMYEVEEQESKGLFADQRKAIQDHKKFKQRMEEKRKQLTENVRQKKLGRKLFESIEDILFSPLFYQKQGILKSIMKRYPNNPVMKYLYQNLATQTGGEFQSQAEGDNFSNAQTREARKFGLQLAKIVSLNDINGMSDGEISLLRSILTSQIKDQRNIPDNVKKAAGQMRNLMNQIYEYIRGSGLDIGYAESGYMQRLLDQEMVNAQSRKFFQQAKKVYEVIFDKDIGDINVASLDQMEAVIKFIQDSRLGIVNSEEYINFVQSSKWKKIKGLKAVIKKANDDGDTKKAEDAQAELDEAIANIEEEYAEFFDQMRDLFGTVSSTNWFNAITEAQVGDTLVGTPQSNFTKKRTLPPEADALLEQFYISDPVENIQQYILGATRRAEFNRRFGKNKIPQEDKEGRIPKDEYTDYIEYLVKRRLRQLAVDPKDADRFAKTIDFITGKSRSNRSLGMAGDKAANYLSAIMSITLLVRAPIASIAEPFTTAITSESPAKGMMAFIKTLQEFPGIRKLGGNKEDVRLRQQFARVLGVIDDPEVGDILTNRIGGAFVDNPNLQRLTQKFFYKTKLTGMTNAQRRSAAAIGFQFISEMAYEYKNPTSDRQKLKAKKVLNDFGVKDKTIDQFADYILDFNDFTSTRLRKRARVKGKTKLPELSDIMNDAGQYSDMGLQLAVAIQRFTDQTIQDPRIADRPLWAENPLGRIVYGITSFIYSFQDKVLKGMARKVGREYKISKELGASKKKATLDATAYVTASIAPAVMTLFAGHFLVSTVRELIFNEERFDREWEDNDKDAVKFVKDYLFPLAFARSGFTGAFDPFYQMVTGLKYQRDLANTLIGTAGYAAQNLEPIIEYGFNINNSENTLASEYNALVGLWNLTVNPVLSTGYALIPMSPPTALIGAPGLMYLSSEDFKRARVNDLLELIYGEKYIRGKRGRPSKKYKTPNE